MSLVHFSYELALSYQHFIRHEVPSAYGANERDRVAR